MRLEPTESYLTSFFQGMLVEQLSVGCLGEGGKKKKKKKKKTGGRGGGGGVRGGMREKKRDILPKSYVVSYLRIRKALFLTFVYVIFST